MIEDGEESNGVDSNASGGSTIGMSATVSMNTFIRDIHTEYFGLRKVSEYVLPTMGVPKAFWRWR